MALSDINQDVSSINDEQENEDVVTIEKLDSFDDFYKTYKPLSKTTSSLTLTKPKKSHNSLTNRTNHPARMCSEL